VFGSICGGCSHNPWDFLVRNESTPTKEEGPTGGTFIGGLQPSRSFLED